MYSVIYRLWLRDFRLRLERKHRKYVSFVLLKYENKTLCILPGVYRVRKLNIHLWTAWQPLNMFIQTHSLKYNSFFIDFQNLFNQLNWWEYSTRRCTKWRYISYYYIHYRLEKNAKLSAWTSLLLIAITLLIIFKIKVWYKRGIQEGNKNGNIGVNNLRGSSQSYSERSSFVNHSE